MKTLTYPTTIRSLYFHNFKENHKNSYSEPMAPHQIHLLSHEQGEKDHSFNTRQITLNKT